MKETFFEEVDTIYFKTMQEIQTSKYNSQVSCFTLELQTIKMNLENMPIRAFFAFAVFITLFSQRWFLCRQIRKPNTWGINVATLHDIYRSFSLSEHTLVIKQEVQVLTHSLKTLPLSLLQIGFGRRDQLGVVELKYLLKKQGR